MEVIFTAARTEIDEMATPFIYIFDLMERDILVAIAERLIEYNGVDKGSMVWLARKLSEVTDLNAEIMKILSRYSGVEQKEIKKMFQTAGYSVLDTPALQDGYKKGVIEADPQVLRSSVAMRTIIEEAQRDLETQVETIKTKALEYARKDYSSILHKAYISTASGVEDVNTAVRKGILDMAARGITAATYQQPSGKILRYSIESCVRRDTITAVHQLADKSAVTVCGQLGCDYVEVSAHMGARVSTKDPIANHAGWQGKVYKISGSEPGYPNLAEKTGYPDDILGLGGVNCRHQMYPFIPGVSVPSAMDVNSAENQKAYALSQEQRKREREIRRLKKELAVAKATEDPKEKEIKAKLKQKQLNMEQWCKENNLRRDWSREAVAGEL